jgi:hypothetical protein
LVLVLIALALGQTGLAGCKAFVVAVERPDQLQDRTVRVDLVGLTELERAEWSSIPLAVYWEPGEPHRIKAKDEGFLREYVFRAGGDESRMLLGKGDPIWDTWVSRKAEHLFVYAEGLPDRRRVEMLLEKPKGKDGIKITVLPGRIGVQPYTAPKERK